MLKLNSTRPLFPFTEVTRAFELGSQASNEDKGGVGGGEGSLLGEKSISSWLRGSQLLDQDKKSLDVTFFLLIVCGRRQPQLSQVYPPDELHTFRRQILVTRGQTQYELFPFVQHKCDVLECGMGRTLKSDLSAPFLFGVEQLTSVLRATS